MTVLSPFVYWAQNEDNLFIKVDLRDVKHPNVIVEKRKLQFASKGLGAHGLNDYKFHIDFHSEVVENKNNVKVTDHKIDLTLAKVEKGWWPRLTSHPQKPAWLKVDFDRWQSEDDLIDENVGDIRENYPELYSKLQKEEIGYRKEDFKKVYLTLYNILMLCGYLYVTAILSIGYFRDGEDFFSHAYQAVGSVMCCLQLLQFLEVLHPIFGYVKGGALIPFLQIFGRFFVLILMLEQEPRMQKMPVVYGLFVVWCTVEVIRYPYYLSQIYKVEIIFMKWLRYSAWMILYPFGFICEGIIIFRNLVYMDESIRWSISLPNRFNFTFHFPTLLRIYMLFIMIPGMYVLMAHMSKVRNQKLGYDKPRKIRKS